MVFKPGEVNNPNGARKERLFYSALRLALDYRPPFLRESRRGNKAFHASLEIATWSSSCVSAR
jgi:hypothetical protein